MGQLCRTDWLPQTRPEPSQTIGQIPAGFWNVEGRNQVLRRYG